MSSVKILGGHVHVYTVYIVQGGASKFSRVGQINP